MASARSSGMFPKQAAWVDLETTFPANADLMEVPNLQHSGLVSFVAYFSANAVGTVAIQRADNSPVCSLTAPAGGGKVIVQRSGIEIGTLTQIKCVRTGLTAGTAQVSLF